MITVKCTREGLVGGVTASGYIVDTIVPFVALPAMRALGMAVRLHNPRNATGLIAIVLDVGPWNINDDAYVFGGHRPEAETGTDSTGRPTNGSGIDLGEKAWSVLGMTDNTDIAWEFISPAPYHHPKSADLAMFDEAQSKAAARFFYTWYELVAQNPANMGEVNGNATHRRRRLHRLRQRA
jgi:hypothetical protein